MRCLQGFAVNDAITVVAEVSLLSETHTFVRDPELSPTGLMQPSSMDVLGGKFTWKVYPCSPACSMCAATVLLIVHGLIACRD